MIISYLVGLASFFLAIYETYLIVFFIINLFNADNVDEFRELGTRNVSTEDIIHYLKYINRAEMDTNKIKRMEKYLQQSILAKKLKNLEKRKLKMRTEMKEADAKKIKLKYRMKKDDPLRKSELMLKNQGNEQHDQSSALDLAGSVL